MKETRASDSPLRSGFRELLQAAAFTCEKSVSKAGYGSCCATDGFTKEIPAPEFPVLASISDGPLSLDQLRDSEPSTGFFLLCLHARPSAPPLCGVYDRTTLEMRDLSSRI
jgi:hypothetical protein